MKVIFYIFLLGFSIISFAGDDPYAFNEPLPEALESAVYFLTKSIKGRGGSYNQMDLSRLRNERLYIIKLIKPVFSLIDAKNCSQIISFYYSDFEQTYRDAYLNDFQRFQDIISNFYGQLRLRIYAERRNQNSIVADIELEQNHIALIKRLATDNEERSGITSKAPSSSYFKESIVARIEDENFHFLQEFQQQIESFIDAEDYFPPGAEFPLYLSFSMGAIPAPPFPFSANEPTLLVRFRRGGLNYHINGYRFAFGGEEETIAFGILSGTVYRKVIPDNKTLIVPATKIIKDALMQVIPVQACIHYNHVQGFIDEKDASASNLDS